MTNPDTEIATVTRKLAKTIDKHTQIMQQLAAIGKKIEDHLDNPESDELTGLLGVLARGRRWGTGDWAAHRHPC